MTNQAIIPYKEPPKRELDSPPPDPRAAFQNLIIHPKNLALEERQANARSLDKKEYARKLKRLTELNKLLTDTNYDALMARYKTLAQQYKMIQQSIHHDLAQEGDPDGLSSVMEQNDKLLGEAGRLRAQLEHMYPLAKEQQAIIAILKDHKLAVARETLHKQISEGLKKECEEWGSIIQQRWSGRGYRHEVFNGKKRIVRLPKFAEIHVTPDAVYYKIAVTGKRWFGYADLLPFGVDATDLISEETCKELTIALQRDVIGVATKTNGAWLIVSRHNVTDRILEKVTLDQILAYYPHSDREYIPIPLGVGERREISWFMLAQNPHVLIAGTTGGGKSVYTNSTICTLITHHSPDEVRIVCIDLKEGGSEFKDYANVPHLLMPIVSEVEPAVNALVQLEALRSERMKYIADAGCRNILEYNDLHPHKKMAHIIIFCDEYARVKARGKEFADQADRAVDEIAALGRAAGVHFITATQTPYVKILPGTTKANMAVRVAFSLPTAESSKAVIGTGEATTIPDVKGRCIVAIGSKRWSVQAPFVSSLDIEDYVGQACQKPPASEEIILPLTSKLKAFDEEQLIDIVIKDMEGNLGAKPLYEYLRHSKKLTLDRLREMVEAVKARGEVEHQGTRYQVMRKRKGWILSSGTSDDDL